jgi:DedD protein
VKERLTGAIILVALMVLLVPELLTGPIRSAPRAAALASATAGAPLRSYTIDLADEGHAHGSTAPASGPPLPTTGQAESASAGSGSVEAQGMSNSPAPVAPASGAATESLADSPVSPAGKTGGTSAGNTNAGSSSPAGSASAAGGVKSSGSATGAGGVKGAAEDGSGTWIVQLGSFASRANAEHLAQQVRSQGFQVSVSQSSSGRRLYRVRVGTAHDRAAALALAARLRALGHSGSVLPRQGGA